MAKQVDYWANLQEGRSYHIYNRSINKENIFKEDAYSELFLRKLKIFILPFFDIEAYCMMPNHYHLLARVKPISDEILKKINQQGTSKSIKFSQNKISYNDFLADQFKRLFQSFVLIYNKEKRRNGSLFQKRFKRILIKDEIKWQHILIYIHHNPIHHKFRKSYSDWKFSSYLIFLSNTNTFIARKNVLKRFDDDFEISKKLFVEHHQNFKIKNDMDDLYLDEL